jgi:hypothetical protein
MVKSVLQLSIAAATSIFLTGCMQMQVGDAAYLSAQSDATKQKFLDDFNEINLEREKSGLKLLDYCKELRRLSTTMAKNDEECKN